MGGPRLAMSHLSVRAQSFRPATGPRGQSESSRITNPCYLAAPALPCYYPPLLPFDILEAGTVKYPAIINFYRFNMHVLELHVCWCLLQRTHRPHNPGREVTLQRYLCGAGNGDTSGYGSSVSQESMQVSDSQTTQCFRSTKYSR